MTTEPIKTEELPPFKPKTGEGVRYDVSQNSTIDLFVGEDDSVVLIFTKTGKENSFRLSGRAAEVLAYALVREVGFKSDLRTPPIA